MRRGDVHTIAGGKDHAGKPRPVAIVQDDSFDGTDSVTICAFTTDPTIKRHGTRRPLRAGGRAASARCGGC